VIANSTEALLGVLKWVLLGLLYLFFARVLWAVWSEVRHTNPEATAKRDGQPQMANAGHAAPHAPPPTAPTASHAPGPVITVNVPTEAPAQGGHAAHAPAAHAAHVAAQPGSADPTTPALYVPTPMAPDLDQPTHRNARKAARYASSASKQKAPKGKRGEIGRLVVLQPRSTKGNAFAIGAELSVGRAAGNTVSLADDTFASQVHARIFRGNGGTWVEDLGSTNGTFVNGRRIVAAQLLGIGDRVQVGNTIFEAQ
jgi:hypothetical protein